MQASFAKKGREPICWIPAMSSFEMWQIFGPGLDDVDRRCDDGGAESCDDGRREVTRDPVLEDAVADERVLRDVIDDDLADVDDHVASNVREGA